MENSEPLPFYKQPIYYSSAITLIGIILLIYSIVKNNGSSNLIIPAVLITTLFGGLTYFMWKTRCPKCKKIFVKKEDESKEKDLGTRNIKRYYISEIHKTKDGEVINEEEDYKMWPARFIQRFFYCKKCGYGNNNEWHDDEKGVFKNWEKNNQWNPPKPKIIYFRENEDGEYERVSNGKKRIPIKTSLRREIYNRAENACQTCGTHDALDIHHIDENPANNNKNNLIVLCASCHRKVGSKTKIQLQNMAIKPYKKSKTINIYK